LSRLRTLPFEDLGFASLDHHRAIRQGFPEVIFCEGKTEQQVVGIARGLLKTSQPLLATRVEPNIARALLRLSRHAVYHEPARIVAVQKRKPRLIGDILIISAGTSDIPIAEEARITAEVMGSCVEVMYDVGVAGIHRLFSRHERLLKARVLIVVAGMDGADESRLRSQFRRTRRALDHVELLRGRCRGPQHRQRFRSGLPRPPHQCARGLARAQSLIVTHYSP